MNYTKYTANNSGGRWWLTDEQWFALENAGWEVIWKKQQYLEALQNGEKFASIYKTDENGRWLGALATEAIRRGLGLREAAKEWENITGESATDTGCPCCGQPHDFTEYDENDKYVKSGPSIDYVAAWED